MCDRWLCSTTLGSGIDTKGRDSRDLIGVTGENVFSAADIVFASGCDIEVVTEIRGRENAEPMSVKVSDLALTGIVGATAGT